MTDNTDITDASRRGGFAGGPLLSIEGLHVRQFDRPALRGLDLAAAPGEVVGISGDVSAMSALRDCLLGRAAAQSGAIRFAGQAIAGWRPAKILAAGLYDADNTRRVRDGDSILEDAAGGARGGSAPSRRSLLGNLMGGLMGGPGDAAKAKARRALEIVGLGDRADESAQGRYGPDRSRIELARALVAAPKLILLNRSANGIGESEAEDMRAVYAAAAAAGPGLLLFDLDLPALLRICPRMVLLDAGRKRADDTPAALRADAALAEVFVALKMD